MDTLSTVHTVSITTTIIETINALGWILVFSGLLIYWLKQLMQAKAAAKGPWIKFFLLDNVLEFVFSIAACVILVLMGYATNPVNQATIAGDFGVGYMSSSLLNALITNIKPTSITPKQP